MNNVMSNSILLNSDNRLIIISIIFRKSIDKYLSLYFYNDSHILNKGMFLKLYTSSSIKKV